MTTSDGPAISITALTKSFGATRALDSLDLTVATGEVHGFPGPNGSGTTTTIRVLLGLLRPDAGEVRMLGELRHLTRTSITVETAERPAGIEALPGVYDVVVEDHHARFDVDTAQLDAVLRRLAPLGVRGLTSTPPTLEELFLRHYGDERVAS